MKRLKCDTCGVVYSKPEDLELAQKMSKPWAESCRADGTEPKGVAPCPNITCPGELVLEEIQSWAIR